MHYGDCITEPSYYVYTETFPLILWRFSFNLKLFQRTGRESLKPDWSYLSTFLPHLIICPTLRNHSASTKFLSLGFVPAQSQITLIFITYILLGKFSNCRQNYIPSLNLSPYQRHVFHSRLIWQIPIRFYENLINYSYKINNKLRKVCVINCSPYILF